MGTIARTSKAGGGTNFNSGQTIDPAEVNTDFNTAFTEINGALDDGNVKTATIPGSKSLRFTEISAPANPSANDALLYAVDDNATTRLQYRDSAGTVTWLGSVGARVSNSAAISIITSGTRQALTFDTERYDTSGFHSTVTNTGRLTVPTGMAGKYLITGGVDWAASATGVRKCEIRLNGTTLLASHNSGTIPASGIEQAICTIYNLAAADYVELTVLQTSGGALDVNSTGNISPEFAMQWLGA